jgi:hypothetical protein
VRGGPTRKVLGQGDIGMGQDLGTQRRLGAGTDGASASQARQGGDAASLAPPLLPAVDLRSGTPKARAASTRTSPASRARSKRSRKSAGSCFLPQESYPGRLHRNLL